MRTKQKGYSQEAIDRVFSDDILFDSKKHIIDPGDVLASITELRLPAQERMLQEFRTILGDVKATVHQLSAPENAPYVLVSNLIEATSPEVLYVAELSLDEASIIAAATLNFNYQNKRRPSKYLLIKLALQLAGLNCNGWTLHENRIFTFYNMELEPAFNTIIDVGTIEELTSKDLSNHELSEYHNLFKYLMKNTLRDQLLSFKINWSNQQKQFYFLPKEEGKDIRKEDWVGKKQSRRRVFECKFQTKDPTKVAFFKHLAFDVSFLEVDTQWYASITPSWYYTWNLYKRNRYHDDLLSKQKRLEHNHSVRDQVRFIGYFLGNRRNDTDLLTFGELIEFQCISNISLDNDDNLAETLEEEIHHAD